MPWRVCVYSNYRVTLSCFGAFHGFYDAIVAHSIYGFVINHKCQFYKIIRLRVHKTLRSTRTWTSCLTPSFTGHVRLNY